MYSNSFFITELILEQMDSFPISTNVDNTKSLPVAVEFSAQFLLRSYLIIEHKDLGLFALNQLTPLIFAQSCFLIANKAWKTSDTKWRENVANSACLLSGE